MTQDTNHTCHSSRTGTQKPRTVIGFDFGTRRIGVAIGQELTATASPLKTLVCKNSKPDWVSIEQLITEWRPNLLVLGIPYNMDATEHEMTRAARKFGRQLHGRFGLVVEEIDERLTSVEAEREIATRPKRRNRTKEQIDSIAARIILESWLNKQKNHAPAN